MTHVFPSAARLPVPPQSVPDTSLRLRPHDNQPHFLLRLVVAAPAEKSWGSLQPVSPAAPFQALISLTFNMTFWAPSAAQQGERERRPAAAACARAPAQPRTSLCHLPAGWADALGLPHFARPRGHGAISVRLG